MGLGVNICSELKALLAGGAAKASLNRATEFDALDPKPGDLGMTRMKVQ